MTSREHEPIVVPPQRVARTTEEAPRAASGDLLPAPLANQAEASFGVDFGDVRVHRDAAAGAEARRQGAQAFTRGDDITVAAGQYDPASRTGQELLAHELAHVVQQRRGGRGGATADAETRADRAASDVVAGRGVDAATLGAAPVGVQRKPGDGPGTDTAKPHTDSADTPANGARQFSRVLDGFAVDKDTLTQAHRDAIDGLAFSISLHVGMLARGKARIEIVGHADTTGKEGHNEVVGQNRADRVREALAKAITPRSGEKPPTLDWSVRSAGESELLIPTKDNTLEPRNRAVEVRVTIESMPAPQPAPAVPDLTLRKLPDPGPMVPRQPTDDWWKRAEEAQRKIDEYDRKHPKRDKSAQDFVVDAVMEAVIDPILKKLPVSKELRDKARDAIKGGIESGTEKVCEAAIDRTGATGPEADALKAACKAAIKSKPGEKK